MADDGQLAADVDVKVKAIDDRLRQISTYKFLPPSVIDEKKRLEAQKADLLAGKNNSDASQSQNSSGDAANSINQTQGKPPAVPQAQTSPAEEDPAISAPAADQTQSPPAQAAVVAENAGGDSSAQPGVWKSARNESEEIVLPMMSTPTTPNLADKITFGAGNEGDAKQDGSKKDSLVGSDYTLNDHGEDSGYNASSWKTPETDDGPELAAAPKSSNESAKSSNAASLPIVSQAKELVDTISAVLSQSAGNPDRKYLESVVAEFSKAVKHLEERSQQVKMDDDRKNAAIKGRLSLYLEQLRAELEFSELLGADIENKIKNLI